MQFFAPSEKIKSYLIWTFGSFSGLSWEQLLVFLLAAIAGIGIAVYMLKGIAGMRLGEDYAHSMGIHIGRTRLGILLSSALLTAAATAFVGPVAFVGLAVPHICRMFFKITQIKRLLILVILTGILLMLLFVWLTGIFPGGMLPVNIITSLVGTPIVVSIIMNRKQYRWNE
jgi:iron complex transport system permease protein